MSKIICDGMLSCIGEIMKINLIIYKPGLFSIQFSISQLISLESFSLATQPNNVISKSIFVAVSTCII